MNCTEFSSVKLYLYTQFYVLFKNIKQKIQKFVSTLVLWLELANHVTKDLTVMQINMLLTGRSAILKE